MQSVPVRVQTDVQSDAAHEEAQHGLSEGGQAARVSVVSQGFQHGRHAGFAHESGAQWKCTRVIWGG